MRQSDDWQHDPHRNMILTFSSTVQRASRHYGGRGGEDWDIHVSYWLNIKFEGGGVLHWSVALLVGHDIKSHYINSCKKCILFSMKSWFWGLKLRTRTISSLWYEKRVIRCSKMEQLTTFQKYYKNKFRNTALMGRVCSQAMGAVLCILIGFQLTDQSA